MFPWTFWLFRGNHSSRIYPWSIKNKGEIKAMFPNNQAFLRVTEHATLCQGNGSASQRSSEKKHPGGMHRFSRFHHNLIGSARHILHGWHPHPVFLNITLILVRTEWSSFAPLKICSEMTLTCGTDKIRCEDGRLLDHHFFSPRVSTYLYILLTTRV